MLVKGIHAFCEIQASTPYLLTRSLRFLRAVAPSTSFALCLHHAHPYVAAEEKNQSHTEKQRVWSRSCALQDLLRTMQWLCSQLCFVTAANQWTLVEIELLASVGWKWGCQPFRCPCSQNVKHCRKEIYSTCLFKTSIPAVPFWNSKHPASTRSRFLRATVRSTSSALCLHHAHPFVVSAEKRTRFMQRSKAFGQAVVVSKICYNAVIVLSVVLCDCCKPKNSCRDWAFSNSGLEVGLPAFQLPMFPKCDSLPKGDLLDMFV